MRFPGIHSFCQWRKSTLGSVIIISLLWLIVINNGQLIGDTPRRLEMTHAWWTRTEEIQNKTVPKDRADLNVGVQGVGGKRYHVYDPGQSLLMLPADWLGTQIYQEFPTLASALRLSPWEIRSITVSFFTFIPLNLAAIIAAFWLLRVLNFSEHIAGLTCLVWLLGTTVLQYAQANQQNHQILLLVLLGYANALTCIKKQNNGFAFLSGLALGGVILIRTTALFHCFSVFMFLTGLVFLSYKNKPFKIFQTLGFWLAGILPLVALERGINYLRFGSWLDTGMTIMQKQWNLDPYFAGLPLIPVDYPFTNPLWVGILGALFSLGKSIFIYDPLLLPCLVLIILSWRKLSLYLKLYFITAIFDLTFLLFFYGRYNIWHADWSWGARFHLTSIHLILLPAIAIFLSNLFTARKVIAGLMSIILALAILVQFSSVAMSVRLEVDQSKMISLDQTLPFRLGMRLTNLACLVDSSFSKNCIVNWQFSDYEFQRIKANNSQPLTTLSIQKTEDLKKLLFQNNRLFFFPFQYPFLHRPKLAFLILISWILLLTITIFLTIKTFWRYWRLIFSKNFRT